MRLLLWDFFFIDYLIVISLDKSRITPQHYEARERETVIFHCESVSEPKWTFSKGDEAECGVGNVRNAVVEGNNLTIHHASGLNQGYYECSGLTEKNQRFFARALLLIRGKF